MQVWWNEEMGIGMERGEREVKKRTEKRELGKESRLLRVKR